jgi:hypothetical protein
VVAAAGNGSATVNWTAPANGGTPITSYTVTPFVGSTAQMATTVSGSPPATTVPIAGLTNGTTYTFTVTATNAIGSSPPSSASNQVTPTASVAPTFVQQVSAGGAGVSSLSVTPATAVVVGNRMIVEVGIWNNGAPTASGVTDSAGNTYLELTHFTATDGTEMSVWSAPITKGGGTKPTVTVKATGVADIGLVALEYSGLSNASDATAVDQMAHNTGVTGAAGTVSSGATAPTTAANEMAIGFYADSGFSDKLTGGAGFSTRVNLSPDPNMELLAEDQVVAGGATANGSAGTGANTIWLMATLVFKTGNASPPTVPAAPTNVSAAGGNGSATVTWTAPTNGGSVITSYTVTPYIGTAPQTATMVTGSPPPTTTTVGALTNGTAYTFTVAATNAVGSGPVSASSNSVTPTVVASPTFVQQSNARASSASSMAVTPATNITSGNRLIVEVGVWSGASSTASGVTDSAGNTYVEVSQFTASDGTEMSVWTAPITKGGGTRPIITAKVTSAAAVSSGSTMPTTAGPELAIGFYADSGFGDSLAADPGYTARANVSPNGNMELLVEDRAVTQGATPAASATTGANTVWLMATLVFKHA